VIAVARPFLGGRRPANGRFGWWLPTAATIGLFVLAEIAVRGGLVLRAAFPAPTEVFRALYDEIQTTAFWDAIWQTLQGWGLGLGIAIAAAIPLGILIGTIPLAYRSVRSLVDFLRPIPSVAQLPLCILVIGITLTLKTYLAAFGAFWPLLFQTMYGVQDVDPVTRDTATAYRLGLRHRFLFISLPGSTPFIATGLRISATYALLVCIGVEFITGLPGLGRSIIQSQQALQVPRMYAYIVTSGLLGLLIAAVFIRLERIALRWHPSQRKEASA
jgi:ABC-type nitrate/sulfonate/bicarbonate transport system permease component